MEFPFLKFYVRDWQADAELRMCSLESKGFWLECLCIMHHAKRRGYMESPQGHPLTDEQTARLIGTFKGDVKRCKEELLLHGVPSVEEETGIWYCRRMVKDTAKSIKCSKAGRKGGGSPLMSQENQIPEAQNTRDQRPETRYHISLKVTFKGRVVDVEVVDGLPQESVDLAAMLATHVARHDPNHAAFGAEEFNKTISNWAYQFKELSSSGRTWKEIKDVLMWAMQEEFWGSRITTAAKFRSKFSDLLIQMNANKVTIPDRTNA